MNKLGFDGIWIPQLAAKPRARAITSILDKGLGPQEVRDLVSVAGNWIDVVKFGWGSARLQPAAVLREKLETYRGADVATCTGGTFLELAYAQGQVDYFLGEAADLGFTMVEVSNGVLPLSQEEKNGLVRAARMRGLLPWTEVGKKNPDEDARLRPADRLAAIQQELDAGAARVILEARESGSLGIYHKSGAPDEELVQELVDGIGIEWLIFEAPRKEQQVWMIRNLGPEVNLGNVAPAEALPLATLRTGLRGDTLVQFHAASIADDARVVAG